MTVITAAPPRLAAEFREAWANREVLYFLALRDIKLRYRQTVFGIAWALLQPVSTAVVFTLFFGRWAEVETDVPYPLFAYSGLVVWFFVSSGVIAAANSLAGASNTNLITKVYFPRILIPVASVLPWLLDLVVSAALIGVFMAYYGVSPGPGVWALPLLVVLMAFVALAIGGGLAALNLRYRDVRYVLPLAVQLWMFATPIIYPIQYLPRWRWVLSLNPLSGVVETWRSLLFGLPVDWALLGSSIAVAFCAAVTSWWYFWYTERTFADLV